MADPDRNYEGAPGGAVGWGTASRKVASSIPHGVIEIFHWHKPSGLTVALGSIQPLTEMSTRNLIFYNQLFALYTMFLSF